MSVRFITEPLVFKYRFYDFLTFSQNLLRVCIQYKFNECDGLILMVDLIANTFNFE